MNPQLLFNTLDSKEKQQQPLKKVKEFLSENDEGQKNYIFP